jgi:hypothetical protein
MQETIGDELPGHEADGLPFHAEGPERELQKRAVAEQQHQQVDDDVAEDQRLRDGWDIDVHGAAAL